MGIFDRLKHKVKLPKASEIDASHDHAHAKAHAPARKHEDAVGGAVPAAALAVRQVPAGSAANRVIVRPLLSERAVIGEAQGVYTFIVDRGATKSGIKAAIRDLYGVVPTAVRTANVQGKPARFGRNTSVHSDWKKAVVTLPSGTHIQIHEGV